MFDLLKEAVSKQFKAMCATGLYRVDIDPDLLWETYLNSFPEGTNPIYKTRREYDCSACRQFVKHLGGVVSIVENQVVTIWDGRPEGFAHPVLHAMAELVRHQPIQNRYIHTEHSVGVCKNRQLLDDKSVKEWSHFYVTLPRDVVFRGVDIGPTLAAARATHDVMARGLAEIDIETIDTVIELISQGSLYRGEEHLPSLQAFRALRQQYERARDKDVFVWDNSSVLAGRIRNTVIGTLLVDLVSGVDLEAAVNSFEAKVAPTNYKRPKALVTKAMVLNAQKVVDELGLTSALDRRYARIDDITINNVLFADRSAKKAMSAFDEVAAGVPVSPKSLAKVEEVGIEDFITKILPRAESLEVMFENRHAPNLVSLIAPVDPTAKQLFKWPNNFSWSYVGEVADSIKERVKAAGGNVTGDFRASLSWFNYDDLDLHLVEPTGEEIYYGSKSSRRGGTLDVDMNAGWGRTRTPVENIVYANRDRMPEGRYLLFVENYSKRETQDVGFEVEMEFDGVTHSFSYAKPLSTKERVEVCTFNYARKGAMEIVKSLPSSPATKTIWGVPTQTFHKVRVVMLSPNHWDGIATGNKHYIFALDGCRNEGKARGFFNEFLNEGLTPHRKVLEVVGSKMRTEESEHQLSGLGFSSTQRNYLFCKVQGSFSRTVMIVF